METKGYVLKVPIRLNQIISDGYYTGKSFIFKHSRYAVVDRDITKAKVYSSQKRAINATEMGFENYYFEVVALK